MDSRLTRVFRQAATSNAGAVLEGITRVGEERTTRMVRLATPTVVHYTPSADVPTDLTPPGTVTVFIAPSGDPFLADVADAYTRADADRITALAQTFTDTLSRLSTRLGGQNIAGVPTVELAADDLVALDVVADLQYRGKVLAHSLGLVFDLPFMKMSLPYNGGPLTDTDFSLIEYYKPNAQSSLEAIVVVRRPALTEAEEEALDLVPAELEELNVGHEVAIFPAILTTALLVVAATTLTTITICGGRAATSLHDAMNDVPTILEDEIRDLGPIPTAHALLALRQRAFMQI
jgi:hypothetical protein